MGKMKLVYSGVSTDFTEEVKKSLHELTKKATVRAPSQQ